MLLVYLVAGYFLLASLIGRSRNSKERISARSKLLARTSFGLAALGTLCIGYSFCEPYRPEVTHVTIVSPKLAKAAKSLRIVHISDLHSDPKPRLEDRLPAIISSQHPDFIVFTGDSVNSLDGIPVFRRLMSNLASIAPTFVVKGNWDQWPGSSERLFDGTGVVHLDGYAIRREFGGTPIWITGRDYGRTFKASDLFVSIPPNEFSLFLFHLPDEIFTIADQNVDLYCAGHTHGGQVALPLYGALITFSAFDKQFESGLHKIRQTMLYVNRGIGMEGNPAPRIRFCARPEITVIDVVPAA